MTDAAKLLFWDDSWDLREKECPCDVHFIEWLDREKITGSAIYHFGTGNHHHVGIECARESRRNSVLGITAAPQEYQKYIELAIARPEVLRTYNAVFGDIYLLNAKLLPVFDVVTLFHLCEFRGERTDAYGGRNATSMSQTSSPTRRDPAATSCSSPRASPSPGTAR